jgi:CRP/FNR family transcriptional regulator, cyclic AMP receptor protein
MSVRRETELLQNVPLFAAIDPLQLQVLVFSADRIEIAANEVLFAAGDPVGAGHLVLLGQGEVLKPSRDKAAARQERVATVEAGAFLGELSMVANLPATITVRALTPLRTLRIGNDLFLRVCGEFPDIGAKVKEALALRLDTSLEDLREAQVYFDRARPFSRS